MNAVDIVSEPDLFAVACPRCAAAIAVMDDLVGEPAACPVCQAPFLVPEPELPAPPAGRGAATADAAAESDPAWQEMRSSLAEAAAQPVERHRDLEFREPVRTIETEEGTIELRRLSDEEKRARRTRRNLVMLAVGTVILIVITALLGRDKKER